MLTVLGSLKLCDSSIKAGAAPGPGLSADHFRGPMNDEAVQIRAPCTPDCVCAYTSTGSRPSMIHYTRNLGPGSSGRVADDDDDGL